MKKQAIQRLKRKLGNKECVYGIWVSLESASITEIAVALGLDWIIIDAEHGHLDYSSILAHIRAAVRSNTVVLVRISEVQEGLVKRILDIGADGILAPHIETVEELERVVAYSRYPPAGVRGIGAERATCWGQCFQEHVMEADDNILIVPIIESIKAGDNIKELVKVPGVDIFYFGPADYCASAGYPGRWDEPSVIGHIEKAKNEVLKANKYCGIVTGGIEDLKFRSDQGYRMLAFGFDTGILIKSLRQMLAAVNKDRKMLTSLAVDEFKPDNSIAVAPPPEYAPDRFEKVYKLNEGLSMELADGITCTSLVGSHTAAVDLFTGIVHFEKDTVLPAHSHPHSESITLLSGKAVVAVENRRYVLNRFDNITIPRDIVHSVQNIADEGQSVFHMAMPTINPYRELEDLPDVELKQVADHFNGHKGPERVTRYSTALRYAAGPQTEFIDFFNDSLIPGIGMSGGFGLFYTGGRLPAHLHDFDESICIVEGEASCFVEGRKYTLSDHDTALQPRGRVHYFINEFQKPMSMIWVYAGPMPERLVINDDYATHGLEKAATGNIQAI